MILTKILYLFGVILKTIFRLWKMTTELCSVCNKRLDLIPGGIMGKGDVFENFKPIFVTTIYKKNNFLIFMGI